MRFFCLAALLASVVVAERHGAPTAVVSRDNSNEGSSRLSNAQRLAAGLPLNPPRRRWTGTRPHAPRDSGLPCVKGAIAITNQTVDHGFLAAAVNATNGLYNSTVPLQSDPNVLQVCISTQLQSGPVSQRRRAVTSPLDIATLNSPLPNLPYLIAINGFQNKNATLTPDNDNYVYIGPGVQTPAGSPAQAGDNGYTQATGRPESIESNVWELDTATGNLQLVWTNEDGSEQPTIFLFSEDTFLATADIVDVIRTYESFNEIFAPVNFTFVPF